MYEYSPIFFQLVYLSVPVYFLVDAALCGRVTSGSPHKDKEKAF